MDCDRSRGAQVGIGGRALSVSNDRLVAHSADPNCGGTWASLAITSIWAIDWLTNCSAAAEEM